MATKIWLSTSNGNLGTTGNWTGGTPVSGDDVIFPAGTPAVTAGLTSLNTATLSGALGKVVFEEGYTGAVGTTSANMQFTCTRFDFKGSGVAYIDLQASAIAPQIFGTSSATTGLRGLYLIGSALTTLSISGTSFVGVASRAGETSTVATVRVIGPAADVWLGSGVSLTTLLVENCSSVLCRCAATTITVYAGTVKILEVGAVTTLNVYGGTVNPESTGTIATVNALGGTIDAMGSGAARTWTTLNQNPQPGCSSTVQYDPNIVTVTNLGAPTLPQKKTVSQAA